MALPQRTVLIWAALGVAVVGLAVGLARVGSQLDSEKLERQDLEAEVDDLEQDVDALTEERDTLQRQTDEQLKSIEQLKVELERSRGGGQQASPAATPP